MARHIPSVIWAFYREPKSGGRLRSGYVQTIDPQTIEVTVTGHDRVTYGIFLTRDEARMMVKRINQCLEGTKGR